METNYTLKRLKLFWPVLALLMLSTFLVNAQNIVPSASIDVTNNTIVGGLEFCDELSATQTVVGERLNHETTLPGIMTINTSAANITSATITIIWEWSLTGDVETYKEVLSNPPPVNISATPINEPKTPYLLNGTAAVTTGHYDLEVTAAGQDVYFRRVVLVVTNDPGVRATVATDEVFFGFTASEDLCKTQTIDFADESLFEFCEGETGCFTIIGSGSDDSVCEEHYQWWSKTDPALAWEPIMIDGTGKDYYGCVTETTYFLRDIGVGAPLSTTEPPACTTATITVTFYPLPPDRDMTGPFEICIEKGADEAGGNYGVTSYAGETYYWQVSSDYGRIDGPTNQPSVGAIWDTETTLTQDAWIQVTIKDENGCQRIIVRDVEIYKKKADAGADQIVCGEDFTLNATDNLAVDQVGTWTGPVGAVYTDVNSPTTQVTYAFATNSTVNNFTWTLTPHITGCPDADVVQVTQYKQPFITSVTNNGPICGTTAVITVNTSTPQFEGVWTVNGAAVPAGVSITPGTHTATKRVYNVSLVAPYVYGTYQFTYTTTNGTCTPAVGSTSITFSEKVQAIAGASQEICNNFNPGKTWATANLNATSVSSPAVGTWTLVSKPTGANDPTFPEGVPGLNNAEAKILVTSFGRYEFRWTVKNGLCETSATTTVEFYPGIKDVEVIPATLSACTLSFNTTIGASRDAGGLSGVNNLNHRIKGTITVQKRGSGGWAPHNHNASVGGWSVTSTGTATVSSPSGATLTVTGANQSNIDQALTFNMIEYGEYRLIWKAHIENKNNTKIITPNACEAQAQADYKLYWQPTAILVQEYGYSQVCSLSKWTGAGTTANPWVISGGTPVTLVGSDPFQITTGVTVTNVGTPAIPVYEWVQDTGGGSFIWNRSRISWTVKKEVGGVWVNANWTTVKGQAAEVYVEIFRANTEQERGKKITAWALVQGKYRFEYTIDNLAGGCSDIAYQDITFLQEPLAGADGPQEVCGFIDPRDSDCEGWNSVTRFVAEMSVTGSNANLPTISGYWSIDYSNDWKKIIVGTEVVGKPQTLGDVNNPDGLIGYLPDFSGGTWTPSKDRGVGATPRHVLHDWIKVDGVLAYTVNASNGNLVWAHGAGKLGSKPDAKIEVSRHGIFPFKWVATNPIARTQDGGCADEVADHTVYYKNTPLARDITPIRVISQGGSLLYGGIQSPWDKCYACDNDVTTFYMLERPIVEQAHKVDGVNVKPDDFHSLSGGFLSTIPGTQSVRWYTTAGGDGQKGAVINQPIKGGTIVRTYALRDTKTTITGTNAGSYHPLVHQAPLLNHNKHHIVEIKWDNEPLGEIIYEEENTVTECVVTNKYVFTKVSPQEITGVTPVPAFTSEKDGDKHVYTLVEGAQDEANPIPGAVYEWEIEADGDSKILGGWYNVAGNDVWVNNTNHATTGLGSGYISTTEIAREGLYKIHVYWGAGQTTSTETRAHGYVKANIEYYCHGAIAPFLVLINENTLVGQLKYWNQDETFIPTPFLLHPNNIPDYFYVRLWESVMVNTATSGPAVWKEKLTPIEETRILANTDLTSDYFGQQAFWEFKSLDLNKTYRLQVWDGGYSYLDEPLGAGDQNYMSYTYTWNGWTPDNVNATDALAVIRMMGGLVDLNDPDASDYWWVGNKSIIGDLPYGFYSNALANVNSDALLNIVDVRQLLFRIVGTYAQFFNNTPNFKVAGRFGDMLPFNSFGDGDAVTGFSRANDEDVAFSYFRTNNDLDFVESGLYLEDVVNNVTYEGTANPNRIFFVSDKIKLADNSSFMNIYYTSTGDVVSRNSAPKGGNVVKSATAELEYIGQIEAKTGDLVTIPVRVSQSAEIGAITLGLKFDSKLMEIVEVDAEFSNIDNENGLLRVAMVDPQGRVFGANEAILNVTARILGDVESAKLFELHRMTEIADPSAFVLDVTLNTDAVSANSVTNVVDPGMGRLTISNYPNPFRTDTRIEYTLPESGRVSLVVYNNVGQVVANLVNEVQEAGFQSVELTSADLGANDGMFIYRIVVEGQSRTYTGTGNLMLMK